MSKSKYLEEIKKLLDELLEGIDREKLKEGDVEEVTKFRYNISKRMQQLIFAPLSKKVKILQIFEAAAFELIAQIPVVTPVITAVLQTVTGKDLASKMDRMLELQNKILERQDKMLELQNKTIEILNKITDTLDKRLYPSS